MIRCSDCNEGSMAEVKIENYDVSSVVGLDTVMLDQARVLKCERCGHVMFPGDVIDAITHELAKLIIRKEDGLRPVEVRFLRELMGMTQAELGDRLGVSRATVNRWEMGDGAGSVQSLALRTLAVWDLDDADLAREIGKPQRARPKARSVSTYHVGVNAS